MRQGTRGPIPQFCSIRCKSKRDRARPERKEYEREYRRRERLLGKRKAYEYAYNRRPEVKARNATRMRIKWHTDPEYRAKQLARWGVLHPEVVVSAPYTGHRWLDMARNAVLKSSNLDDSKPWADDYHDEMGEAVLALLEGRDMSEAITNYRKKEYVPRKLTIRLGDWSDDEEAERRWFDSVMPTSASAEDEAIERETIRDYYVKTRFNNVGTKSRRMKHKTQQPSRRRMNNGKGWRRTGALG